jgi:hypothetical protein
LCDTCNVCDAARFSGYAGTSSIDVQLHKNRAEAAQGVFRQDKSNAKSENYPAVVTMDLQQALPTPKIPTNKIFYCRQLWTYNFGIHLCDDNSATMCVWPEFTASRGADEVGSCVLKALPLTVKNNKRKLIVWSDCCSGQNKNYKMICVWLYMIQQNMFDEIQHKFFVPGHSMMDSDRDFGLIEQKKRTEQYVYTHDHWIDLIKKTRVKNPFTVLEMKKRDILDLKHIENGLIRRKKLDNGSNLSIKKLGMIKVSKAHPGTVFVKYNYNADFRPWLSLNLFPRNGHVWIPPSLNHIPLKYPSGRPIKEVKKRDLNSILCFIPPVHHEYFMNIDVEGGEEEDYLVSEEVEESEAW